MSWEKVANKVLLGAVSLENWGRMYEFTMTTLKAVPTVRFASAAVGLTLGFDGVHEALVHDPGNQTGSRFIFWRVLLAELASWEQDCRGSGWLLGYSGHLFLWE